MRIVFIYNGTESLGIEYISSLLKSKGHQVFLIFDPSVFRGEVFINIKSLAKLYNIDKYIIRKAIELKPDLVAFSSYSGNYRWCLSIAQAIKQISRVPIVFGGVHSTAVPERVLANDFIDFVILGEGEFAMLDLIEHLAAPEPRERLFNTPNICFQYDGAPQIIPPRAYIEDLDSLPFPDKQLFFDAEPFFENNPYLIISSRGCPYDCSYCSNSMYKELYRENKQHVRRRSPDNVIEELLHAKKRWKIKQVQFMDDVFTFSKPWLEDFIEKYKLKIGLPFYCYSNPLTVTKDIAALLKNGGCYLLGLGVQSGSERVRREDYGRHESNSRIIETMFYLKANKVNVQVDHIFGAPSENKEDLEKSLQLYRVMKPQIILTFWLTFYPKTRIIGLARKRGILSQEDVNRIEEGYVGYTHDVGSAIKERIPLFSRYELMIELASVCHNDQICSLLLKIAPIVPFKKMFSYFIYTFTGIRYNRDYIFNKFRYVFLKALSSKHKPFLKKLPI